MTAEKLLNAFDSNFLYDLSIEIYGEPKFNYSTPHEKIEKLTKDMIQIVSIKWKKCLRQRVYLLRLKMVDSRNSHRIEYYKLSLEHEKLLKRLNNPSIWTPEDRGEINKK